METGPTEGKQDSPPPIINVVELDQQDIIELPSTSNTRVFATPPSETLSEDFSREAFSVDNAATTEAKDNPQDVACNVPACQRLAGPFCLLLWLCLAGCSQGLSVNGFVNVAVTHIELRYHLTSFESSLVAAMYHIGNLICAIPVSYLGPRLGRCRVIALGMLAMAAGSIVFSIPHFLSPPYVYQSPVPPKCYPSGVDYPEFCTEDRASQNKFKFVFWLGQFLHGAGASPLYTSAVAYLYDNFSTKKSSAYLGTFFSFSLIGSAIGFLLGSQFVQMFVHPSVRPTDLLPHDASLWVGAWWLGFPLCALVSLLTVVPLYSFPRSLPGSAQQRQRNRLEAARISGLTLGVEQQQLELSHLKLCGSLRILWQNLSFIFLCLASAMQMLFLAGFSTFGSKILQTLFYFSSISSTSIMGALVVSGGVIGIICGSMLVRLANLPLQRMLWFCTASAGINTVVSLGMLMHCEGRKFAGINWHYPSSPDEPIISLFAKCNRHCHCRHSRFMYSPVCGADSIIYFSPCFAGCLDNGTVFNNVRYFYNCSCIAGKIYFPSAPESGFSAAQGTVECQPEKRCKTTALFISVMFIFTTCQFSLCVPLYLCTMRIVPHALKDLGLGVHGFIIRSIGGIPGLLLLGYIFDAVCSLWNSACGLKGSCSYYNSTYFWLAVLTFTVISKMLEVVFLALAAALYSPPGPLRECPIVVTGLDLTSQSCTRRCNRRSAFGMQKVEILD